MLGRNEGVNLDIKLASALRFRKAGMNHISFGIDDRESSQADAHRND